MPPGTRELEGLTLASGRYLITSTLGEGGMGTVYRALDRNIEADVVIKIPRRAMMDDPEFAGRFTREIRSLVKLSHPHIVKVTDVGTWEGTPFAVMQFLPGGSLEDRRAIGADGRPNPCDPKSIARWLVSVARALDYIHAQGYVHRDVKPGNILFDAQGHAFLSDFGVAKVLASAPDQRSSQTAMTGLGMVLGTPEYMAPELIMGENFDGRVDQYALAVTVYELLCGRQPFEHETKTKVLVLHTSQPPPPLSEWRPELPEALSQAVLKALNKGPKERYPNCAAFAAAVAATVSGGAAIEPYIRLKCPQCGKTGEITGGDYRKLRDSGRRPTCSACRVPLDALSVGSEGRAGGPRTDSGKRAAPSATVKETVLPAGPDVGRPNTANRTPPPVRTGTVAMPSSTGCAPDPASAAHKPPPVRRGSKTIIEGPAQQGQPGLSPTDPEANRNPTRRGSQTVIERPSLHAEEPALAAAFNSIPSSAGQTVKMPVIAETRPTSELKPTQSLSAQAWIVVGASAAASLVLVTLLVIWLVGRNEVSPTAVQANSQGSPNRGQPAADSTTPGPGAPPPSRTQTAQSGTDAAPTHTKPKILVEKATVAQSDPVIALDSGEDRQEPLLSSTEGGETATSAVPKANAAEPPANESDLLVAATTNSNPKNRPAPSKAWPTFDVANLKRKPIKKYSLTKVLATPSAYAGQLVVPMGMYRLAPSTTDHVNDTRKYLAIARAIEAHKNNLLGMSSSPAIELDVEPKLAGRLDKLGSDQLRNKLTILTLWFGSGGHPLLVKVEILEKYVLGFKKATHFPEGDLDYETLSVSSEGADLYWAPDEEWEQANRLHHFARNYRARVGVFKRVLSHREISIIRDHMNSMYRTMMTSAGAREAEELQLRDLRGD